LIDGVCALSGEKRGRFLCCQLCWGCEGEVLGPAVADGCALPDILGGEEVEWKGLEW